ncbi:PBP1A family penicillin-binding protein [Rhodoblastus acidophilus]|uniref:peptidoglycan glycosyltransferase n=1 Tax=Candidatus Rhodoblastus alkanivorans TaxID=2954117 RepID=A0ABS9ZCJ2_9HYPH|nr:PBP1A family penicillin-binding protein [Candidatus Rhodoblastus alkanivorans]MCI4679788.1 PBP1A family penicillin-binding protein [Candidatus Rhodoblastus alkanivorans]MCI4684292.1 PBP1A family penicillin-binding protein [Candidatus Rhodoblastus alkanivorans]MDI4641612.1 PBP1A family penicillin-binding protein [Rhodoblastus acidophilus]
MAYDFEKAGWFRALRNALLWIDSWIDSTFYSLGVDTGELWRDFSSFMERFHVRGASRAAVELACEALTLGVFGGVVMVTLAQPAFRLTASPNWLKKTDLAVTFEDRYGKEVGRRGILHDDAVPLDQYPDYVVQAVISTEDRRFYDHWGVDPIGLLRALTVNARASGVVQGGSTLTQQLAKNLFLSNERTITRKINEAFLAFWLESHLTKKQILRLYLDRAYMGGGAFGIQAAAQFYFGRSIKDVTLAQAAMLAGLFKAPTKFAPHVNLPAARARANEVLNNMVAAGYLQENQIADALRHPASPVDRAGEAPTPDWYLDWAFNEVKALADAGKLGKDRVVTVRTALDSGLQQKAESTIDQMLRESGPSFDAHQGAAIVMEPDGAVRALVGGHDYAVSQFNRATDALRQPGSSFKPYVYLTALMSGKFTPYTTVVDAPICLGNWCPKNYGGHFRGSMPLWNALAHSINSVAVRLSVAVGDGNAKLGRSRIIATARRLGVTAPLPDTQSLPLGADEVSPMDQATGYAAFANGGKRVKPYAALEIYNSRGELVYSHDRDGEKPQQVIDPRYINELVFMMTQVVQQGTGRRAQLDGIEVAGKTGTTNDYKDAWFCGYTGNFVGIVWYGNDDDQAMNKMTGGSMPAATWHDIMQYAHSGVDLKPLPGMTLANPVGPVAQFTSADGGQTPVAREQLSKNAAQALGTIEILMKMAGEKHGAVDLAGPHYAKAGLSVVAARRPAPIVNLR